MQAAHLRAWDPGDFAPGRVSRSRCTWGGNGPDAPCTEEIKYTVTDRINRRWSSCEHHLNAYDNSRPTP
ncbi:hypothetical protein ACLQ2R_26775 [Streptosporangium sp. DT93]|uniref:hypothetical protein n=1 Tax=Streptosporangium sp. DT93 TaxID=3393428 RepID=UPI003CF4926D